MSAKVDVLIAAPGAGSKAAKARDLGILIITEDDFIAIVEGEAEIEPCEIEGKLTFVQTKEFLSSEGPVAKQDGAQVKPKPDLPLHCPSCAWLGAADSFARGFDKALGDYLTCPSCHAVHALAGGGISRFKKPDAKTPVIPAIEAAISSVAGEEVFRSALKVAKGEERIIAAAIQIEGVTLSLPLPARHGQVLYAAEALYMPDYRLTHATQGFLTSTGRFVNRVQAKQIAHIAGQPQLRPEGEHRGRDLFSEDLW